jgi:hypothetical protein
MRAEHNKILRHQYGAADLRLVKNGKDYKTKDESSCHVYPDQKDE